MYEALPARYKEARQKYDRPLTLAEKILTAHLDHWPEDGKTPVRGETYAFLRPDRVAMQDATAQMALLQFMQAQLRMVAVPSTVHCDHLIQARVGAQKDMAQALSENSEVYDFLRSASNKHGIGFWKPGAGIIHQVVLENYAIPGAMMIGTDSHTPNAGGLGMIAIGVGGADAVDVMAGEPWGVRWPKLIGVHLKGSLNGWTSPKDVILKLAGILTVAGGTGAIIEYFGDGTKSISCTGKATITNMGAELGATTSVFPFDSRMSKYLRATRRADVADIAEKFADYLVADQEIAQAPKTYFDQVIEIDLDSLEPYVVGPHTPDLARPVSELAAEMKAKGYPSNFKYALIGSCTNSSYEDMTRAAHVAQQAVDHGLKASIGFLITPGSEQIFETITRDGQLQTLEEMGGTVLANACGPCIGQWKREDITAGETNAIITSFNRNFQKRNDGNAETMAFIGSPEIVTAFAISGSLSFNPMKDTLTAKDGTQIHLQPPEAPELPVNGFVTEDSGYLAPADDGDKVQVVVKPDSPRLQLLAPFAPWDGQDYEHLPVLLKALGKCTTDKKTFPAVARHYKQEGLGWVVVGDQNYGEGSSREHAAMSPRFLGCKAVIVRSFARIAETNLKKQGILPLTFIDAGDYDKIQEKDKISLVGLARLAPGEPVEMIIEHADGEKETTQVKHTLTEEQVGWFKAGSALNLIRERQQAKS
jgi:aconitate hydratase